MNGTRAPDRLVDFDSTSIADPALHAKYLIEDDFLSYVGRTTPHGAICTWILERLAEMAPQS
jgi:hypothetical protein